MVLAISLPTAFSNICLTNYGSPVSIPKTAYACYLLSAQYLNHQIIEWTIFTKRSNKLHLFLQQISDSILYLLTRAGL